MNFHLLLFFSLFSILGETFSIGEMENENRQELPGVYEYYTDGGIASGLTAEKDGFKLNGKPIKLFSAAVHYFRIHPDLWRDRMKRIRAAGMNVLETYVPWNLHEPRRGVFDFGQGNEEFSIFLNVRRYIQMAQEEDLLVIFRPGPYICSEWDFGGLPSWLMTDPDMKVRTSYSGYEARAKIYLENIVPLVADLQWMNGGPIIAVQVENEYGAFAVASLDIPHLEFLKTTMENAGVRELLFTSDSPLTARDRGAIPGVLQTANFQIGAPAQLDVLLELQPDKPIFVAEFWSGWFDHWLEPLHNTVSATQMGNVLEVIFGRYNGSVNFYMFHGGTNFGFMAGANSLPIFPFYLPDVTSYDYNAPLSEAGDYEAKYYKARELIEKYQEVALFRPEMPEENPKTAYPSVQNQFYLEWLDIVSQVPDSAKFTADRPLAMEELDMNDGNGQSYGYILYRNKVNIGNGSSVKIGRARDLCTVVVDGELKSNPLQTLADLNTGFGYWTKAEQEMFLELSDEKERTVDLIVENLGRINFGVARDFSFRKGLHEGQIFLNNEEMNQIEIMALEFKSHWVKSLKNFKFVTGNESFKGPTMFRSQFSIIEKPTDTFLDMSDWHKGVVFINGFNIGRYFKAGPPQTLYIPAPLLNQGLNTITIFEMFKPSDKVVFTNEPYLGKEN